VGNLRRGLLCGATGLVHFGFKTDDLEKSVGTLKENGVEFTQEVTEIRPGVKISFFKVVLILSLLNGLNMMELVNL